MDNKVKGFLAFIVGLVFGSVAMFMVPIFMQPKILSPYDVNGDGKISSTEFRAAIGSLFLMLDINQNGVVESVEFQQQMQSLRPTLAHAINANMRMTLIDANRDGGITRKEMLHPTSLKVLFDANDADGNGFLSRDEAGAPIFDFLFP